MYEKDQASRDLGIEIEVVGVGAVSAAMKVRRSMLNGFDICHGGFIFTLADTAFAFACNAYDNLTVAAAANIEFLRPAHENDRLTAVASESHRGRRNGVYDVEVRNQSGELVALFRGRSHATGKVLRAAKTDT
jgi:acyl-CoA thioesterase